MSPVNSNFGSNKRSVGTFIYGSELTGLSGGTRYASSIFPAGQPVEEHFSNWIVMPRNSVLSIIVWNGGSELTVTIPFFYNIIS